MANVYNSKTFALKYNHSFAKAWKITTVKATLAHKEHSEILALELVPLLSCLKKYPFKEPIIHDIIPINKIKTDMMNIYTQPKSLLMGS